MKFIPPLEISSKIMTLIKEANRELIIVSPYIQILYWTKMRKCLADAVDRKINITFFTRDEERNNNSENYNFVRDIGINLILVKNLHAKVYLNENYGIVTSQNLYFYSDVNSIEVGYLTERTREKKELVDFVNKYIGNIEARNNITFLEKKSEQVEVQKIALSTSQLEYLNEALRKNFQHCKLTQTSSYIFNGNILSFADLMIDNELTVKIRKNLHGVEYLVQILENINFSSRSSYKIKTQSTH